MFGLARTILDWTDKKYDEAMETDNERDSLRKAAMSGFVEGLIDGAVIAYPFLVIGLLVANHKNKDK
jgi:hypothetical protein